MPVQQELLPQPSHALVKHVSQGLDRREPLQHALFVRPALTLTMGFVTFAQLGLCPLPLVPRNVLPVLVDSNPLTL